MFKYEDEGMKRKNRVYVSLTDDELLMLHNYKIQIRAPSLSMALATLVKNGAKMVQLCTIFQETNNERKERSKEKEETKKELREEEETRTREILEDGFLPTADVEKGEYVESLLTDNTEHLNALLMLCHLPPQEDLKAWFKPFIERFRLDLLASGEDLYLLDRGRLKGRFKYWFLKHYNDNETDDTTRNRDGTVDAERALQEYKNSIDWDAIKLRNHFE